MAGPLTGLRVLDIATVLAAPSAATLLADYGADVLKLELPGIGDSSRGFPPFKEGKPLWWKVSNRGKKLGTVDLRKPEGVALFKRLLPRFDVLVENFRPGTLDAWGLTTDVLWALQPRLVILRATAFGQDGPYRNRPGFARIFEAMSGLTYITGDTKGEPMHTGYPIGDAIGGLFGAVGVLAACWNRVRNPDTPGEEIDLSLTEATLKLLDFLVIEHDQLGSVRERTGNANQYSAPAAVFHTSDGHWVSLSGSTNAIWANNCRAIGRPDLIEDPRFSNNAQRVAHGAELNRMFRDWCAQNTLADILARFEEAQGTIAPIYSAEQVVNDPQLRARKAFYDVPDAHFGRVKMQGVVPRFAHAPCEVRWSAGDVGQDNDEIYKTGLGLSTDEMDALRRDGVI